MKTTVGQVRAALFGLPADMPIEFTPITSAFLGTNNPLRFEEMNVYKGTGFAEPGEPGAYLAVHLVEDRKERDE